MTFQRARSEEQRQVRRRVILDTAAAMLDEMPVAELSLNELSRRVGLAKSNVLRYFESREEILLELMSRELRRWVAEVADELTAAIDPHVSATERGDQLAAVLSRSLRDHPVLCDLLNAQPGVLEHNVSTDVVVRYKRSGADLHATLVDLVRGVLPELGNDGARTLCMVAPTIAAAFYPYSRPSARVLDAYRVAPTLNALRFDTPAILETTLATLITGTLARSATANRPFTQQATPGIAARSQSLGNNRACETTP
ncbi:TetR/AcrR family transcriptional regulator [Nocardia transvalensis]|uniref:TetR/AcrR family transcriptional regulator n=1 Tax=Nocardia transvalensis TaxID=37333 RepID=UPI0018936323|nr:TetR/AcrR family transcriptional regulator [Nocardia transvalensis]MBF6331059.1 TetR/AcrR family transcriptional regulator [Nocardia transvalensis]